MGEKRIFKTTRELTIQKMYRQWDDYIVGEIVIGEVIGWHTDKYGKKCPIIKTLDVQFKKDSAKYQDRNLVLNSCGMLTKRISSGEIDIGVCIQVEYKGTNVIEKGIYKGKDAHAIDIKLVEEDTGESSEEEVEL